MAQPRIFVSSTCYDLQEIRFQLRTFIEDFGFEPVMSEFGDIFFDYQKHIQDSCKDEIEKCQLFVLIVGNNYGSIYYKQKDFAKLPDSVTIQEFKKSIEVNIFKHIFVNKFVDYDYKNYQKALNKEIAIYFDRNKIENENIDDTVISIKKEFINKYPFPQDSYKFIFNFLDIIYNLKTNNAIITYESFEDVKFSLKKQWAGFMYESITKHKTIPVSSLDKVVEKIERVENQIRSLVENQINQDNNSKITFDISKLTTEIGFEEFKNIRDEIHDKIFDLLNVDINFMEFKARIILRKELTTVNIENWFLSLENIIKQYKWAKSVSTLIIFKGLGVKFTWLRNQPEIPFDLVFSFYNIYLNVKESFAKEDYDAFLKLFAIEFNKLYKPEKVDDNL